MGPGDTIGLIAVCVAFTAVSLPMMRAFARRLEGRGSDPALQPADPVLAHEVEDLRGRLAEVEERLDFAERMLAESRQPERLPEGHR